VLQLRVFEVLKKMTWNSLSLERVTATDGTELELELFSGPRKVLAVRSL
jgi:hypothetical protein